VVKLSPLHDQPAGAFGRGVIHARLFGSRIDAGPDAPDEVCLLGLLGRMA
jgi:hypothetical protein